MKNLSLNEMENVSGGGWFTQIFGRDWSPCMQMAPGTNGEEGLCAQHGTSWLWGSGSQGCACE
jgi:hypothetical protein